MPISLFSLPPSSFVAVCHLAAAAIVTSSHVSARQMVDLLHRLAVADADGSGFPDRYTGCPISP
jgi:hypothetical protein